MTAELHVALVEPDIPWNAGNVGRTCLAVGAKLHLIRPFGFSLEDRRVRRAGLDYWPHVDLQTWSGWGEFERALPELGTPWLFTAEAPRTLWQVDLAPPCVLIFGRESVGLPQRVRRRFARSLVSIPMDAGPVRSLNVSTAAAVALFEARRQHAGGG